MSRRQREAGPRVAVAAVAVEAFGRRSAMPGELLVRVTVDHPVAAFAVAG